MSLIEMMILGFLSERSMCGYELRKKMEQLQGYTRKFSDGAIYPATNRLVEAGLISEQASIRDGRQRRVFTLLDAGRAKLIDELKSTSGFNLTDFIRWTVVLTFLSVVPDKTDRDAGNPLSAEQIDDPYRKGIITVHDAQIAAELEWLRSMLEM